MFNSIMKLIVILGAIFSVVMLFISNMNKNMVETVYWGSILLMFCLQEIYYTIDKEK